MAEVLVVTQFQKVKIVHIHVHEFRLLLSVAIVHKLYNKVITIGIWFWILI